MENQEPNNDVADNKSIVPHIVIASVIAIAVLAFLFWPAPKQPEAPVVVETTIPEPVAEPEPVVVEPEPVYEPEPIVEAPVDPEPEPEPEVIDTSDGAVKSQLLVLSGYEALGHLLVNDDLLTRFVVFTTNLADQELVNSHHVLQPPQQKFRVYQQADKEWIDSASYRRYSLYKEALETIDTQGLILLYNKYKASIDEIYAEIGDGGEFDEVFMQAINHLLDTPEIPVPVAVFTNSVMYKYTDDRLESLSAPQKQLLRTGPENMRSIKAKLREIKQALSQG